MSEIVEAAKAFSGILSEIYGDLLKPGVRQVGKALETVMGLGNTLLIPAEKLNGRSKVLFEQNMEQYRKKIADTHEDEVVGVRPEIGVPILEKLAYVADPQLSSLYISLLASGSNTTRIGKAHPSFVGVIGNLSPDEAILLDNFLKARDIPIVKASFVRGETFKIIGDAYLAAEVLDALSYPKNVESYIANLIGLGILSVDFNRNVQYPEYYEQIIKLHQSEFRPRLPSDGEAQLSIVGGAAFLTAYGRNFLEACRGEPSHFPKSPFPPERTILR